MFALEGVLNGGGGRSPFPAGVTVIDSELRDGVISVLLSEEASSLAGFALTLARAAVVLTLTELDEGIDGVRLSVAGQPADLSVFRASDFVLGELVLGDTERRIVLFFPDETGRAVSESHTLVVRETDTADFYVRYMLEELIKGPRTPGLKPVFPEGTRLLGVYLEGGVCAVNFSHEFLSGADGMAVSAGMILHCLVRSVTAQPGVSAVRLLIDGQSPEMFGATVTTQPLRVSDVVIAEMQID
jgi:germination protein M